MSGHLASEQIGQLFVETDAGRDRLEYTEYGTGDAWVVLLPGLLMPRRMHDHLARTLASAGAHVVTLDFLGHGRSDRPDDPFAYSVTAFARQVVALLDHLEEESAVVGGTSLGSNIALELAVHYPDRARALFIEMPVLDNALSAVAGLFAPVLLGLKFGRPFFEGLSLATRAVPRTHHLVDIGLDWVRQRPGPSQAVFEGLLLGETAPHREERVKIDHQTLIVGHPRDPLHPFSDSGMLLEELPNARLVEADSILEWRLNPERLNDELSEFLEEVWAPNLRAVATG